MTTIVAIDCLVHHSMVLALKVSSYRAEQDRKRQIESKILYLIGGIQEVVIRIR